MSIRQCGCAAGNKGDEGQERIGASPRLRLRNAALRRHALHRHRYGRGAAPLDEG